MPFIHTVGPKYPCKDCEKKLYDSYYNALSLAKANGVKSIAFPVISVGKYSYPKGEACRIAINAVRDWRTANDPDWELQEIFSCVDYRLYEAMENTISARWEVMDIN